MAKMSVEQALMLAQQHLQAGRLAEAETVCQAIVAGYPNEHLALHLLAIIACNKGQPQEAVALLDRAIAVEPRDGRCHTVRSIALRILGRFPEAAESAKRALAVQPGLSEAEESLGMSLAAMGKVHEGEAALRRAIAGNPANATAHEELATLLQGQGRLYEAEEIYRQALTIKPDYVEALTNLGVVLQMMSRVDEAESFYRQALAIRPAFPDAESNLGSLLHGVGRLDEAEAACKRAMAVKPDHANAHTNMGAALHAQGRIAEAKASYWRGSDLRPESPVAHSCALFSEVYMPDVTLQRLAEVTSDWDRRHARQLRSTKPYENTRDPDRPIRIGFVSADFYRHPVSLFSVRGIENFDKQNYPVYIYSDRTAKDQLSMRLAAATAVWREVRGVPDDVLAEQIRADRVDILFDLAGHGMGNRLLMFARKPAPIQITWLGYEGTTGLSAIDYILADRYEIPDEHVPFYVEKPLRLPEIYVCFDPFPASPPVGPLPALARGYVTFGSFNNLAKITEEVAALWAGILKRVPGSKLCMRYKGLEGGVGFKRYVKMFGEVGITPDRLDFSGWTPHYEALVKYNEVDIGLDPFPFSGSMTSCDSLWMGVPLITVPGRTFAGRHTYTHLVNIGLQELVAESQEHYADLAVALAQDLPRLAALRAGLRERVDKSILCNGPRFAEHLMQALRGVWKDWVRENPA